MARNARHAIVVFGAAVGSDGEPRLMLRQRLRVARALAFADPALAIIVTGGAVRGRAAEGPVMARWLELAGIAPARIAVEAEARTTLENAQRVVPLLRALGVQQVTIVTQPFHARRARLDLAAALRAAGLAHVALDVAPATDPRPAGERLVARAVEALKVQGDRLLRLAAALRLPRAARGRKRRRDGASR